MSISSFLGIETALRGLEAQQRALDVTGTNITNANTPGYTRRVATLVETQGLRDVPAGVLGTGVSVQSYTRIRDGVLDYQARGQGMLLGYQTARRDGLSQVEATLSEPSDTGLSSLFDKFWSSWQDLANQPTSTAARQAVLGSAQSVAGAIQGLQSRLTQIDGDTQQGITTTINDLNDTVSQIARLDDAISSQTKTGQQVDGGLLDQRDLMLDKLSSLANVTITPQADGSTTLAIGSFTLLSSGTQTQVTSVSALGSNLTSGKLAGLVSLDTSIAGSGGYLSELDTLASSLISAVNTQQAAGYTLNGSASTQAFFTGTDASSIAVNSALTADSSLIAASGAPNEPGNGDNALAIANLRGSTSIDGAYQSLVTEIGSDSREAQRNADVAQTLSDAVENKRESVMGVSIDEEMANLVRFQRGYQASARVMNAMDDVLQTLIERTGRVGL